MGQHTGRSIRAQVSIGAWVGLASCLVVMGCVDLDALDVGDLGPPDLTPHYLLDARFVFDDAGVCGDGLLDGDETDVDCGGGCKPCDTDKTCAGPHDCGSGFCINLHCAPSSCSDGVQNGLETDVDCGGTHCPACNDGLMCKLAIDCRSGICTGDVCQTVVTCADGVRDGQESGTDCGGPNCAACQIGQPCVLARDCQSAVCQDTTCGQPTQVQAFGCGSYVTCDNACLPTNEACEDQCFLQINSSSGRADAQALFNCLESQCPSIGAKGVCNSHSGFYSKEDCNLCYSAAQTQGQPCYSALLTCEDDG